jgi:hypothetical protein
MPEAGYVTLLFTGIPLAFVFMTKNYWLHENRIITEFQLVGFLPVCLNIIVAWWWLFFVCFGF